MIKCEGERVPLIMHESCFHALVDESPKKVLKLEECKECPDREEGYDCDPCTQPGRFK